MTKAPNLMLGACTVISLATTVGWSITDLLATCVNAVHLW